MILGLDISLSSTGWAAAENGEIVESGVIPVSGCDGVARLIQVRNRIMDRVDGTKPKLVIMEDLAFSRNEAYAKEVAGASWMVRAELYTDNIPYVLVGASSLKKFACGHGGSPKNPVKKEHVLKAVFQRWGQDVNSNDQADAIVLGYIGMALSLEWLPTTEAQQAVLETVRKAHRGLDFAPLQTGAGGGGVMSKTLQDALDHFGYVLVTSRYPLPLGPDATNAGGQLAPIGTRFSIIGPCSEEENREYLRFLGRPRTGLPYVYKAIAE